MSTSRAVLLGVITYVACQAVFIALHALTDVELTLVAGAPVALGVSYAVYRRAAGDRTPTAPAIASPRTTGRTDAARPRKVMLREERNGADLRFLWAYVDDTGRLHIDGQDIGPATEMVSSDGEYEWFGTIAAADVARVVALLGGQPGDDVVDLLEREFTGVRSYDLEARLRTSGIPIDRHTWGG